MEEGVEHLMECPPSGDEPLSPGFPFSTYRSKWVEREQQSHWKKWTTTPRKY